MLVQLKQNEIIAALKQYISSQGINLRGKQVDISFTAGRGAAGISADISIEDDEEIPDFMDTAQPAVEKNVLTLVTATAAQDVVTAAEEEQDRVDEPTPAPVAPSGKSLFS